MKEEIKPSAVSELSDDEKKALAQEKSEEAKKARGFDISESDKMEIAKGVSDAQAEKNETKYERRSKACGLSESEWSTSEECLLTRKRCLSQRASAIAESARKHLRSQSRRFRLVAC